MIRALVVSTLAVGLLVPSLAAQQSTGHDAHPAAGATPVLGGELAEHFKGVELTEAQIRDVIAIQSRAHHAMDSLRRSGRDQTDPAFKAEIKKLMDDEHAAFTALLTPAQAERFKANMKAHHEAEARERPALATSLPALATSLPALATSRPVPAMLGADR